MAARTLIRPTAFVDAPFGHDGKVARLAGGLTFFTAVELLNIEGNRRVARHVRQLLDHLAIDGRLTDEDLEALPLEDVEHVDDPETIRRRIRDAAVEIRNHRLGGMTGEARRVAHDVTVELATIINPHPTPTTRDDIDTLIAGIPEPLR